MADPMPRPKLVRWAIYVAVASIVLRLNTLVITLAFTDGSIAKPALVAFFGAVAVAEACVLLFLWRGRRWALILFVLFLVFGLWINRGGPPPSWTTAAIVDFWIQIVLRVATLVLLLLPDSTNWFRQVTAARRR